MPTDQPSLAHKDCGYLVDNLWISYYLLMPFGALPLAASLIGTAKTGVGAKIGSAVFGGLLGGLSGGLEKGVSGLIGSTIGKAGGTNSMAPYYQGAGQTYLAGQHATSQSTSQGQQLAFQAQERQKDRQHELAIEEIRRRSALGSAAIYATRPGNTISFNGSPEEGQAPVPLKEIFGHYPYYQPQMDRTQRQIWQELGEEGLR